MESNSIEENEAPSITAMNCNKNNERNNAEEKDETAWEESNQDTNVIIAENASESEKVSDHDDELDYSSALDDIWNNVPFEELYHAQDEHEETMEINDNGSYDAKSKQTNAMIQNAIHKTKELLTRNFESIHSQALKAFHDNDALQRQVDQLQSLADQRLEEIHRLKGLEMDHRTSLNNLLQALESSKQSCHDYSKHVRTECHLRNDITTLKKERDTLKETCSIHQKKMSTLEEEIKMLKHKMTKLMQEKIKVERESRAALSIAKSLDGYNAMDVDFYKRKVHELNDHLTSKNAMIAELQRQLEDYKRQIERSLSQNRLAQIRSESINTSSGTSSSTDLTIGKRRRNR